MKLLQFYRINEIQLGVKTRKGILDVKMASECFGQSVPVNF
jgi:hypothetical protein